MGPTMKKSLFILIGLPCRYLLHMYNAKIVEHFETCDDIVGIDSDSNQIKWTLQDERA